MPAFVYVSRIQTAKGARHELFGICETIVAFRERTMEDGKKDAVEDASRKVEATIVQLKSWLEEIVEMRVECAKLEFNMLSLYHTICPEVLNGVRDDLHDESVNEDPSRSNQDNDAQ